MSTTPDPTPVDPDLPSSWVDPTPVEVPLEADPVAGSDGLPPQDTTTGAATGTPAGAAEDLPPAAEQARRTASEATAAMRESDLKALYAAAGATQVVVGAVRDTVTETSRWANARLAELRFRRAELAKQAEQMRQRTEDLTEEVTEDVKAAPDMARGRVAELQQQATGTYSDLASRGQRVLDDVRSEVVNRIDPAFDRLQERLEAARRTIRGTAASVPTPPAAPVAEPSVPAPAAPVAESPVPAPAETVVEDVAYEDAVVDEVVIEPHPSTGTDSPQDR
ncbi:hypothetical protein GCM10009616_02320 [Microlunatus lacustris]